MVGAGPAGDRVPVVAERADAELAHGADLVAQPGDLLITPLEAEPDRIHRRGVLDDGQFQAVVPVAGLQPGQRGPFPWIDHLTKRYSDTLAVDDLDFEVKPGVVTCIPRAANGSGKSTTMSLMFCLDHPTKGRVTVNGTRCAAPPPPAARQVGALSKTVAAGRKAHAAIGTRRSCKAVRGCFIH